MISFQVTITVVLKTASARTTTVRAMIALRIRNWSRSDYGHAVANIRISLLTSFDSEMGETYVQKISYRIMQHPFP